jgi:transmembrane sensor
MFSAAYGAPTVTFPTHTLGPDPLLDEAIDWIVRLKNAQVTTADMAALREWRDRSDAHERAFTRAAQIFRCAGIAASELSSESANGAGNRLVGHVLGRRAVLGGAVAAAAAGFVVVRPPFGLWSSLQELSADYRTSKGEQRKIEILSGVSIELNTQTSMALRRQNDRTEIQLISGEAAVKATRSASDPLVMLADNGRITASQAKFNARCSGDQVFVTCLEGMIDIERGGTSVRLRETEQVSYSSAEIGKLSSVDTEQVTAWQSGLLIFRDRPLGNVVDEVNRYRPGKIIIVNAELNKRLVNGTFQIDKLDNFVPQVEQLFGAHATSLPAGVVLLS